MPEPLDEFKSRLERLETWMHSQHWPGDPLRATPPDTGPQDPLHLQDQPAREQKVQQDALAEFRTPVAVREDSGLSARLEKLERWMNTLHGQNGIRVTGTVIDFIPAQARVATTDQSSSALEVQDEGSTVAEAASTLNFVGPSVVATAVGDVVTVTLSPSLYNLEILDGDGSVVASAISITFLGSTTEVLDLGGGNAQVTITPLKTQEDGSDVTDPTTTMNFTGDGVSVADGGGGLVTVTIPGYTLKTQDEGSDVSDPTAIINFTGAGVTAAGPGSTATVNIPGFTLKTQEDGSDKSDPTNILNFTGTATVTGPGSTATVDVPGVTSSNDGSGEEVLKAGTPTTVVARTLIAADASITVAQSAGGDEIEFSCTGSSPAEIAVSEEGDEITATVASFDFVGETITASAAGDDVTVEMSELTFSFCVDGAAVDFIVAAIEAP